MSATNIEHGSLNELVLNLLHQVATHETVESHAKAIEDHGYKLGYSGAVQHLQAYAASHDIDAAWILESFREAVLNHQAALAATAKRDAKHD